MKPLFKFSAIIISVLLLSSFAVHKYYVSITQINYSGKDKALQITSRIFIDDLERLLKQRYGIDAKLGTKKEHSNVDSYIEKYLKKTFTLEVNNTPVTYTYLGKEYDVDIMKCYIEVKEISKKDLKNITVSNTLLFDIYPEQQNIIHFKVGDDRKTTILTKGNDKDVLKF